MLDTGQLESLYYDIKTAFQLNLCKSSIAYVDKHLVSIYWPFVCWWILCKRKQGKRCNSILGRLEEDWCLRCGQRWLACCPSSRSPPPPPPPSSSSSSSPPPELLLISTAPCCNLSRIECVCLRQIQRQIQCALYSRAQNGGRYFWHRWIQTIGFGSVLTF